MRKTSYVKVAAVPAKPETKREVERFYCDVCTELIPKGAKVRQCVLCRRDCHDWWWNDMNNKQPYCSSSDDRDPGDYPSYYCRFCHDLKFGKYDSLYYDIVDEYDNKLDALDQKIKKESLDGTR